MKLAALVYKHVGIERNFSSAPVNNAKKVIMFSLFRRLGAPARSFNWMPAVDVTNPRVTAMLLGLRSH